MCGGIPVLALDGFPIRSIGVCPPHSRAPVPGRAGVDFVRPSRALAIGDFCRSPATPFINVSTIDNTLEFPRQIKINARCSVSQRPPMNFEWIAERKQQCETTWMFVSFLISFPTGVFFFYFFTPAVSPDGCVFFPAVPGFCPGVPMPGRQNEICDRQRICGIY